MSLGKISEKKLLRLMYPDEFPPFSLEDVRAQICREVSGLLGAQVALEERAFHALEVTTAKGTTPSEGHVWRQLAASLPAVTEFQEALGVPESFKGSSRTKPLDVDLDDVYDLDWKRTLRVIFMRGDQPTPIAQDVARRGLITVGDMALSMLQSSRCMRPTIQKTAYRTNLAFRAIARAAGKRNPIWWNTYLDEFSDKATQAFRRIYSWDPATGNQQFILFHDGKKVRVRPFGVSGLYQFQEEPLRDGSLWVARGNVIQPATRFSEAATEALEDLINSDAKERDFQDFFEQNPEFLLALGDYVKIHSQIVLSEDDGGSLIPDFFLEKVDSQLCDICDLKRANREIIRQQRHRERFRDLVMEAVAQLTRYKDWFEDKQNRTLFYDKYGLTAYRPKVVIVIGRRISFDDDVHRLMLESQLPNYVILKTYDDVVSGARRWRSMLLGDRAISLGNEG